LNPNRSRLLNRVGTFHHHVAAVKTRSIDDSQ
jgi:hypothetical protein